MTRDELLALLVGITAGPYDPEGAHSEAERALLAFINDPEITAAFDKIEKWYA